ncbi:hypothetical protein RFI_28781 [Reticulomyxa filosa]|uniref:Uncharacterized protein n=1 Tax=Reticulomyxa filosa TaxID=46433 RepID=X6M563_RETFI|nr:hypothetical protein RFI_28781 [Reticulomyxa filosa]|eukprot:ETO08607.1 hypothetical protein RFI_28781 [Reticulomyxa filosa]
MYIIDLVVIFSYTFSFSLFPPILKKKKKKMVVIFEKEKNSNQKGESIKGIEVFMAHGMLDKVFTVESARYTYGTLIGGNDCAYLAWVPFAGHFAQEFGEFIAEKALKHFGDIPKDLIEYEYVAKASSDWLNRKRKTRKNDQRYAVKLTLNNPPANVQNLALVKQLIDIIQKLDSDPYTGGFIITANSAKGIFSAGYDITTFLKKDKKLTEQYLLTITNLKLVIMESTKPFIACVNGHAFAGGAVLALFCDYRTHQNIPKKKKKIRVGKPSIRFAFNEAAIGIKFTLPVYNLIVHNIGNQNAAYVSSTAKVLSGTQAKELGLLDRCINTDDNDVLFDECVKILENEYFNGTAEAIAHVRKLRYSSLAELQHKNHEKDLIDAVNFFHDNTVQQTFREFLLKRAKF